MAFSSLTEKLNNAFKKLRSKGRLTQQDVKEAMREVKLALLEADVSFGVVKEFVAAVTEKAVGNDVLESLTPAQQVIKIVNEQLTELMGGSGGDSRLITASKPPTVIMMTGLQGSGKTTHCAKLAGLLKKQGKRPLLAACDIYRPAAVKQLEVVGAKVDCPVYSMPEGTPCVEIALGARRHAEKHGNDVLIIDTAGRLHIDEQLMQELSDIKGAVDPDEILLAVDAMIGQDAVNMAKTFDEQLEITGVILTKMDGDTRGGAALSIKKVTGKPIKFVGVGEKLDDIEAFYPDRMASRILGMGDVLTLIDKAQEAFDEKKAAELEKKLREQRFDLNDFLDQMRQMKNMGGFDKILGMLPGAPKNVEIDEKQLARTEAMILSMTEKERAKPDIINASRRKRIADGSGVRVEDVNRLLKQFSQMQKMFRQFGGSGRGKRGRMPFAF